MAFQSIAVDGIEEACRWLEEVGTVVATRGYLNGLDAAAEVIEAELWPRTPVNLQKLVLANRAHAGKGALVTRLTRDLQVDPRGRGGYVEIGFGALGHIALWVEYGHNQVGHKPKVQKLFGKNRRVGDLLGDVEPHPFMRPAFDASQARAIDAFLEAMKRTLKGTSGYSEAA